MEKMSLTALCENLTNLIPICALHMSPVKKETAFLDCKMNLFKNKLTTDLYVKLTDTHWYLDFTSSHPEHTKKSIVYGQMLRLHRKCSFETDFVKGKNDINHGS